VLPTLALERRLDVEVAVQDDRLPPAPLDDGPEIRLAPAEALDRRRHPRLGEAGGEELGAGELVGIGMAGVDADVVLEEPDLGARGEVDPGPELPLRGDRREQLGRRLERGVALEQERRDRRGTEARPERQPSARAQRPGDRILASGDRILASGDRILASGDRILASGGRIGVLVDALRGARRHGEAI